jgi:cyclophilin family peptidyl-prolyl cis-trans isomerase
MSPEIVLFAFLAFALVAAPAGAQAPAPTPEAGAPPRVVLETSLGKIVLELDPAAAPTTVESFLAYVGAGFYDGTVFHRVVPGFVIQGGGFTADLTQKPTRPPIANEAANGLKNLRGSISMARTSDPDSATSQFFISLVDNAALDHRGKTPRDWGYAVFGRVVEGMDVVDAVARVKTGRSGHHQDVPVEPVSILKATLAGAK